MSAAFRPGQPCQSSRAAEYRADGFQCRNLAAKKRAKPQYRLTVFRR